jgi:hypothetical protein
MQTRLSGLALVGGFLICLASSVGLGSVTGRISGTVKDQTGAVVPEVTVTVVNTDTGVRQTTRTDSVGFYSFPELPVGHYDLDTSKPGFKVYRQTGLTIDVNTSLLVDVSLQLGTATQQVTVSAVVAHVETTNTQMGEVVGSTKMETLPLNGRSYTDLLALQPGVVPVSSGQYGSPPVSGSLNPGNVSVSGQRESANGWIVNGANVSDARSMGTGIVPNLDSIAEFRIITNNFDSEYGNYSGGQVNTITKSGTNQFHGDLFEFLRNVDLDARNFYTYNQTNSITGAQIPGSARGPYHQNQFGGTFGGPVIRDRLFFFGDYQGTRQIIGQSSGLVAVPSVAEHTGNFADRASELTGTVNGSYWAQQLAQRLGYAVTVGEPYYASGCTSTAACVFPNAQIPQSAILQLSQNLEKFIPPPNSNGYFTTTSDPQTLRDDKWGSRLDFNQSRLGMISGYYFFDDYALKLPYANASFPGFESAEAARAQMLSLSDTKNIGPTLVNEFRANYMRMQTPGNTPINGLQQSMSALGFVTGPAGVVVTDPAANGVPPIGFNSFGFGLPGHIGNVYQNTYQISDNLAKVKGVHTIKFGGSVHYDSINIKYISVANGEWSFSGSETGIDFADFLIGAPSIFWQSAADPMYSQTRYVGLYAQDSWRATRNLTLNYGLRWDLTTPWEEKHNELEALVPGEQSKVFPGAPLGWVFPGDPGIPPSIAPVRYHDFAPRLGLAYSPSSLSGPLGHLFGGPGKTSMRAGFGIFFTAFEGVSQANIWSDAPFGDWYTSPVPPEFATPFIDRATGYNEGQRFPIPLPPLNISPSNPDTNINWALWLPITGSPTVNTSDRVPYAEHYNLSIQRQIGKTSILSVSYVGTQGHALFSSVEANPGSAALCLSASQPSQVIPGGATCGPNGEGGVYTLANGTVINTTRPLGANFGEDQYFWTIGNSVYNALEVSFRHASGPLEFLAGYTFSKSIDDSSGFEDNINPFNHNISRVISSFDMAHNFIFSYRYELPFSHVFGHNRAARGWVLTGITRFTTGLPVTLSEVDDHSLLGANAGSTLDLPNYTPGDLEYNNPRSGKPYFNPSLFTPEAEGTLGNAARRFFHGPGLNNWDMALHKDTHITESKVLQLRFEFFNIFNHAQFNSPVGNVNNTGLFGYVTSARDPRIGQVALKFFF